MTPTVTLCWPLPRGQNVAANWNWGSCCPYRYLPLTASGFRFTRFEARPYAAIGITILAALAVAVCICGVARPPLAVAHVRADIRTYCGFDIAAIVRSVTSPPSPPSSGGVTLPPSRHRHPKACHHRRYRQNPSDCAFDARYHKTYFSFQYRR